MGPYQRTPKEVARAIRYSRLGVRSVGPVGDFLEIYICIYQVNGFNRISESVGIPHRYDFQQGQGDFFIRTASPLYYDFCLRVFLLKHFWHRFCINTCNKHWNIQNIFWTCGHKSKCCTGCLCTSCMRFHVCINLHYMCWISFTCKNQRKKQKHQIHLQLAKKPLEKLWCKNNGQTRDTHSGKEGSHISHPNRAPKLQSAQNRTTQDAIQSPPGWHVSHVWYIGNLN